MLTTKPRRFSRPEVTFMAGVPLVWAVLLCFHPGGDTNEFFPVVTDDVTRWQVVHLATMVLIPLMGAVVFRLLRGLAGPAARAARAGIAVYAVAYTAWEVLVGVGTGILVNDVNSLTGDDAAAGIALIEQYNRSDVLMALLLVGGAGLTVGLVATGRALVVEAGAPTGVLVLLALSVIAIGFHEPPVGPVGLALFTLAVLVTARRAPTGVPSNQPTRPKEIHHELAR